MAKRKRKAGTRQTTTIAPTEAVFPLIGTEVFWELNPELHEFIESKPPQYFPNYYNYGKQATYGSSYKKSNSPGCAPRHICIPRPCAPV